MAEQEEGWPLGLQPLNLRNRELNTSLSFNTLLTRSPLSSSLSSSDLDIQSTSSFFHDRSITLGSLIGISNILELSRRSTRRRLPEPAAVRNKKNYKSRTWFLSLCSRQSTDAVTMNTSLGHFLETERRAAAGANYRRSNVPSPLAYGVDDFSPGSDSNPLFDGGRVAPPQLGSWADERTLSRDLPSHANGDGTPLLLSCLCGN
ncbi:uncharacterized protein At3g17950-like [Henckelia pumila]|uniref:uncharacterized protein At3g17950-like n=1 Tax=Henckelia pumila TaxID=405737 RepID=UPI003C6E6881